MADREKIIKGLEYCIKSEDCRGCIYWEEIGLHEGCPLNLDVLELLKEQKEKPLRCDKCSCHREDGWCDMHERWVKETDYCSLGAWEGQ